MDHQEVWNLEGLIGHQETLTGHPETSIGHPETLIARLESSIDHQETLSGHQETSIDHLEISIDRPEILNVRLGNSINLQRRVVLGHRQEIWTHPLEDLINRRRQHVVLDHQGVQMLRPEAWSHQEDLIDQLETLISHRGSSNALRETLISSRHRADSARQPEALIYRQEEWSRHLEGSISLHRSVGLVLRVNLRWGRLGQIQMLMAIGGKQKNNLNGLKVLEGLRLPKEVGVR